MVDARLEVLAGVVARVEGKARWLARLATRAAVPGGAAALVLWSATAGGRLTEWWQGTVASLLVLALFAAPGVAGVRAVRAAGASRVAGEAGGRGVEAGRPTAGRPAANRRPGRAARWRTARRGAVGVGVLRDYGDVVGAWGAVAQLAVPWFWLLTAAALLAVPVVVVLAAVAGLLTLAM